jgi:16S rRNA (uracil1498-N3)-methyltransferase
MRRFFVDPPLLHGDSAVIGGQLCRHIATVLRLKSGDRIRLADGAGHEALATITLVTAEGIHVELEPLVMTPGSTPRPLVTLYQGLPKGEKLDLILQKCTELGVARIVPFMATRSVTRLEGEKREKRLARWEKIALEAARQSGRETVPQIAFGADLKEALARDDSDLRLLLWEDEREQGLRQLLDGAPLPESIGIIIGPEGGLTAAEAALAREAGYQPVTLGRRILRTETAGLAVVAILQYLFGDLG